MLIFERIFQANRIFSHLDNKIISAFGCRITSLCNLQGIIGIETKNCVVTVSRRVQDHIIFRRRIIKTFAIFSKRNWIITSPSPDCHIISVVGNVIIIGRAGQINIRHWIWNRSISSINRSSHKNQSLQKIYDLKLYFRKIQRIKKNPFDKKS